MIKFVSDSSCDIDCAELYPVERVPLTISTEEREYIDNDDLDVHEMLDYLAAWKGRSYTACPPTESWLRAYEGGDEIYVITLTGGLSGTYNSALIARDIYLEDHPDAKIFVLDSSSTGSELRLILEHMMECKHKGMSFEETCLSAEDYKATTRLFFAFQSLHNFAQNGRINKVLASAIGMLNISILGTASPEGTVDPINKCRGEKKVIIGMFEEMKKAGYTGGKVYISHAENPALAEKIASMIRSCYPKAQIRIYPCHGLTSYYAERGGIILGCEC